MTLPPYAQTNLNSASYRLDNEPPGQPVPPPAFTREIVYDYEARDYALYLSGELIGFARTHDEGETTLNELVSELIRAQTGIEQSDALRFWKSVEASGDCWLWTASTNGKYGQIYFNGDLIHTHCFSYMLHNGPIPDGLIVRHTCDNPLCVNPNHLLVGTYADNTADMMRRGRARYVSHPGETNGRAKLTGQQVEEIRIGYTGKFGEAAKLARRYGVAKTTISKILRGLSWIENTAPPGEPVPPPAIPCEAETTLGQLEDELMSGQYFARQPTAENAAKAGVQVVPPGEPVPPPGAAETGEPVVFDFPSHGTLEVVAEPATDTRPSAPDTRSCPSCDAPTHAPGMCAACRVEATALLHSDELTFSQYIALAVVGAG
jgi:hypothetical protein